jgi:hypothetical protein|nr:MAG TPA: hypothetical protein [Crassvirales sp.]
MKQKQIKPIPYDFPTTWKLGNKWWFLSAGQYNRLYIHQHFSGKEIIVELHQNLNWSVPEEMQNEQIQLCIDWMFHNIFLKIELLNYNSLGVLLRIFTGMLMKCNVSTIFLQDIHGAIASALWKLYWDNRVKDLPF